MMELQKLTEDGVIRLLRVHGASNEGIASVRENGITGEMLVEFCEEDIRDAFTVFKDRFLVRKLVREYRAPVLKTNSEVIGHTSSDTQPDVLPRSYSSAIEGPSRPSHTTLDPDPNTIKANFNRVTYGDRLSEGRRVTTSAPEQSPGNDKMSPFTFGSPYIFQENKFYDHLPKRPRPNFESSPYAYNNRVPAQDGSFTDDTYPTSKLRKTGHEDLSGRPIKVEMNTEEYPHTLHPPAGGVARRLTQESNDFSNESKSLTEDTSNSSVTGDNQNDDPFSEKSPAFLMGAPSSHRKGTGQSNEVFFFDVSTDHFSAEELLLKKEKRGKPTEAQRIGQIVVRNAAVAAKLWETTPLLKDITEEQKNVFFHHVVSEAPQLHCYKDAVWCRLRECLQNRRKYLLDKDRGKRLPKHAREYLSNVKLEERLTADN